MKIIGQTQGAFLISATEDEIANLLGYWSSYAMRPIEVKPGLEIRVHEVYRHLEKLARMRHELAAAKETLQKSAALMDLVNPVVEAATPPTKEGA